MMVIEMREAAKDKAFDLIEEIKELGHKKKLALCELEDTLYECFESEEDDEVEDEETDMKYRRGKNYRSRKYSMRDHREEDEDYEDRRRDHRGMRMRRY